MDFRELVELGSEPTPSQVAPFLVATLERLGVTTRSDLVRSVHREWANAGGAPLPDETTVTRVKRALAILMTQGIVDNPVFGRYRLLDSDSPSDVAEPHDVEPADDNEDDTTDDEPPVVEREIGSGPQSVYAFYLPTYKAAADAAGQTRWPIKIGMTTTSVGSRMASHRTALPEAPVVTLVLRTDNAALLERVIHGILTLRGHRSDDSGGSEWFVTNPDELRAIHDLAVGRPPLG